MKNKIVMIEESLMEFAKRGRPKKNAIRKNRSSGIESTDDWKDMDDDEMIDSNEFNVDALDMETAEEIEIEEDVFDDKLFKALNNELKIIEPNRRILMFRLKGDLKKLIKGVPMAKIGNNTFLFKLNDGSLKKIFLRDVILESQKHSNRVKMILEDYDYKEREDFDGQPNELTSYNPRTDDDYDNDEDLFYDDEVIIKLDELADKYGFEETPFENEHKEDGIENIKRWVKEETNMEVQLYKEEDDSELSIFFSNGEYSGNDPIETWLKEETWELNFSDIEQLDHEDY